MKKHLKIVVALLMVLTFSFGFGVSLSADPGDCCYMPAKPGCQPDRGHKDQHNICIFTLTDPCDAQGQCQ